MKQCLCSKIIVLCALLTGPQFAVANLITTLGEQDFTNGATSTTGAFLTAGTGEPAPFNGVFSSSDVAGPNFSANWTFSYGAVSPVLDGNLVLGIYEHESAATGNQVASFTLNGIDLTSALNTLFESNAGGNAENNVYTLQLPSAALLTALASGTVNVALSLNGPGLSPLFGETTFNGAALDFSTLNVITQQNPPQPVPEPMMMGLLLIGFSALLAARRKWAKSVVTFG